MTPPRRPLLLRGSLPGWLLAAVIALIAIAPWLVPWPWQQDAGSPSADPSAIIDAATAPRADPVTGRRAEANPSAATVKQLGAVTKASTSGYDQPISAKAAARVKTKPGAYQRVGRIKIPRIGLDVAYGEGVYAAALDRGPGHWPGTPLPGAAGTAVLSGHRNTHTAPFKYLNLLKPGDKIIVSVGKHHPTTFRVDDTSIVPEAKYPAFVLKPAKDPKAAHLTLFACHPEGNPVFRIVIRASLDHEANPKGKG